MAAIETPSGLKFDLSLHLENLIPGAVTFAALYRYQDVLGQHQDQLKPLIDNALASAVVLIGTVYLLGIIAHLLSRCVIDTLSRLTFRWLLLRIFEGGELEEHKYKSEGPFFLWNNAHSIHNIYISTLQEALQSENAEVRLEIGRRRERGRLLRSAALPTIVWLWGDYSFHALWWVIPFLLLYAYAEVMVFEEAHFAHKVT